MTRLLARIRRWLGRHIPPHYAEPPKTDAERDRKLAALIREIER